MAFLSAPLIELLYSGVAINSASACASLVRKSATAWGNGFSMSSLNIGKGERSQVSSVIPGGISSAAARNRAVLYDALRRLPEIPKTCIEL